MRLLNTDTMQDTSSHTQTQMSIDELQSQLKSRKKKKNNSLHVTSLPGFNTAHSIRRVYPAWSPMNKRDDNTHKVR